MIQKKILFAVIGLSAFSLLARDPMDVPVDTVEKLVEAIKTGVSGDRILIAPGEYDLKDVQIATTGDSAKKSHLHTKSVLTYAGTGASPEDTVLIGNGSTHRILMIQSGVGSVVSNLTFKTLNPGNLTGVGLYTYAAPIEVVDCHFIGLVGGNGAAVSDKNGGTVLRNCLFDGNVGTSGGATYQCNSIDCVYTNNVSSLSGGGAYMGNHLRSTFLYNVANPVGGATSNGGGALAYGTATGCEFVGCSNIVSSSHGGVTYYTSALTNCVFRKCYARSNGLIQATPSVVGCTFEDNYGSSIVRNNKAFGLVDMCVFRRNQKVMVDSQAATRSLVRNCLFDSNSNSGGTLSTYSDYLNCTFVNNECKQSPVQTYHTMVNCALSGNTPEDVYSSSMPAMTNCLWVTQEGYSTAHEERIKAAAFGGGRVDDMKFKDPANGDYSPRGIRSPLYNAGYEDDAYLAAVGATDCAGGERRRFDKIDVGAFEMQEKQGLTVIFR